MPETTEGWRKTLDDSGHQLVQLGRQISWIEHKSERNDWSTGEFIKAIESTVEQFRTPLSNVGRSLTSVQAGAEAYFSEIIKNLSPQANMDASRLGSMALLREVQLSIQSVVDFLNATLSSCKVDSDSTETALQAAAQALAEDLKGAGWWLRFVSTDVALRSKSGLGSGVADVAFLHEVSQLTDRIVALRRRLFRLSGEVKQAVEDSSAEKKRKAETGARDF
jgi:hypothetical protein